MINLKLVIQKKQIVLIIRDTSYIISKPVFLVEVICLYIISIMWKGYGSVHVN